MLAPALLLALAAQSSVAPVQELCTDRPGLETGACVVPAGAIQLETALADWATDTAGGVRTSQWILGDSVVRIGIGSASEVQFGWTPWQRVTTREGGIRESVSGVGDAFVAYKARLTPAAAPVVVSLMPFAKLPVARRPLGNRRLEAGVVVPMDIALADRWTLTLSPEADWNADDDGHGHHLGLAAAAGVEFELTETLSAGLSAWAERDADHVRTTRQAVAGASISWLAAPKLAFDWEVDSGVGGAAPDLQLIAGMTIRR